MKRTVSLIMLIVIMALHLMPCSDVFAASRITQQEAVSSTSSHQHSDRTDDCSPFCCCACCIAHSVVKTPMEISPDTFNVSPLYSEYIAGGYLNVNIPVWEPPRLRS